MLITNPHSIDLSPSIRKKGFHGRQASNSNSHFKMALYRNSRVHRITLGNQFKDSKLRVNEWNIIDLKLVTELGLPAQIPDCNATSAHRLPIACQILELKDNKYYSFSDALTIEYRLYEDEADSWSQQTTVPHSPESDEDDDFFSFQSSNHNLVRLQYRIKGNVNNDSEFYIHFEPHQLEKDRIRTQHESPLSLCLGPFQLVDNDISSSPTVQPLGIWDDSPRNVINMYRALPLPEESRYILLQEIWDNGTPGKLWDSALVMNHVFNMLVQVDKGYLCGRRILDLSAGIGAIGLTIAQTCRIYNIPNPPHIVMTDLEEALPLMKSNQQLNHIPESEYVSVERLEWGSFNDIDQVVRNKPFDYILISDVLYNARDFPALVNTFRRLVETNKNTIIIMGYKPRGLNQNEENLFFEKCRAHLSIETLDLESFAKEFFDATPGADSKLAFLRKSRILEKTGVCLYKITQSAKKRRNRVHRVGQQYRLT